MTREEAKTVFLNRGFEEVDNSTYYSPDKWREACVVISEWLEQEPCEDAISCEDIEECKELMTDINGDTVYVVRMSDIRQLPPVKPQESCVVPDTNVGDIISKQTVLDTISELNAISFYEAQEDSKECYYEIRQAIKDLSPVKPQTGHWIMPQQDDGMSDPIYYQVRCSECGFDLDPQTWYQELHQYDADKFCPKCGCPMKIER